VIGKSGIEKVLEIPLDTKEEQALRASAMQLKEITDSLNL
jgi:L-lactate dehydrogenase